ncbi:chaperone protein DnaJ [Variibacter gotjawalensis]|uniref:Chaperone protein DnaJ n=1 Tax=Variibacter gotjawalensis TaxID=1333996 RepID=A0A0S3PY51_9BRAD|nr:DnaJ domain-containing protein [Variibacter gotjawalensis]NIK46654.1 hypothetical protein [Variibacter gotjawalensis]RZS48557.1 DnaJ-like protein [Variibacter gotjawalensis]BAT60819.1 chaperone protein DnaJ [Variibacter gotjawalensis]
MPQLLIAIAIVFFLYFGLQWLKNAKPNQVRDGLKTAGGVAALGIAGLFAVRGQIAIAAPLAMGAMALLGWIPGLPASWTQRWNKTPGQVSRVRTAFVEMELSHDTGEMQGVILAGPYEGTSLDALNVPTLVRLLADIDDESRALLAAYLDRRDSRWRENGDPGQAAGSGVAAGGGGPMTPEEAYQVLGLEAGASADDITRAHRNLMKKIHPDQGGSTYLAARVNMAKDVLLRRHA